MRVLLFGILILLWSSCASYDQLLSIAPNEAKTVNTPNYELSEVRVKNKSSKEIEVKVVNKASGEFVRGFGLANRASAVVLVENESELQLTNTSDAALKVGLSFTEKKVVAKNNDNRKSVSFILKNKSAESIPLLIPGVMNPNLSPFSESGVDLEIGQELFFRAGGKKHILLVVDKTISEGEKIDVAALLKSRKEELGIK